MIFRDFFKVRYAEEESREEGGGVAEVLGVGEKFRKGGGSGNRCGRLKEVPLTAPDIIV